METLKNTLAFIKANYSLPFWAGVALIFGAVGHLPSLVPAVAGVVVFSYAIVDDFRMANSHKNVYGEDPAPAKGASLLVYGGAIVITVLTASLLA